MEPRDSRAEKAIDSTGETTGSRRHAMRLIRGEYDGLVLVYEVTGLRDTDPRMLVIEGSSGRSVTRLERYPANWRALKDADLLALQDRDA